MEVELLPCIICEYLNNTITFCGIRNKFRVECADCYNSSSWYDSIEGAIIDWNTEGR